MGNADTLIELKTLAKLRKGICLSSIYVNARAPMQWKCRFNHVWFASADNVRNKKSWCPTCGREKGNLTRTGKCLLTAEARKAGLDRLITMAKAQGGKCLSKVYSGTRKKYEFQCKRRHKWEARAAAIFTGTWCPYCSQDNLKYSIDEFRAIAEQKGGRCLSRQYVGINVALKFICANGHRWSTQAKRTLGGAWCVQCYQDSVRGTIDEMEAIARSRGGCCLSSRYINSVTHLQWECDRGHRWRARPSAVKHGTWCPICAVRIRAEGAEFKPRRKRKLLK